MKEDTEPPVFYGVKDLTVLEGNAVSYKRGVSVTDNKDKDITFQVDSSKVNINKVGTYKVYYTAQDSAGNKTSKTATVTVEPFVVTDEMLFDKVDAILADITTEGMTKREVAWEIYQWVKAHVGYVGTSDKSDWKKEAYRESLTVSVIALPIMRLLAFLTRAGIDNMRVTR